MEQKMLTDQHRTITLSLLEGKFKREERNRS